MNTLEINNIIIYNNYDKLQHLIDNDLLIDNKIIKNYDLLLSKSIEYKSFECFNLLLNNINIDGFNYYISLNKSIDNYINGNNKYYLNKLLEKKIIINKDILVKAADDFLLFKIFINKVNINNDMLYYINIFIKNNKLNIIEYLYNYNNNHNIIPNDEMCNFIFKKSLKYNNINIILFLENIKYNMIYIINDNNIVIPSLYYSVLYINDNKKILYKYLLNLYSKHDNINLIQNINNINFYENYNSLLYINQVIYDLMKLNIIINNLDEITKYLLLKIFSLENEIIINNIIETIFIIIINNKFNNDYLNILSDININSYNSNKKRINLYYILLYYNYNLPENINTYFLKLISYNNIELIMNNYIHQLLLLYS
jgi:hypothetical protein